MINLNEKEIGCLEVWMEPCQCELHSKKTNLGKTQP